MAKVKMSDKTDAQLQAMLHKNSGASVRDVKSALSELKKRGLPTPPEKNVTGGREYAKGGDTKTTTTVNYKINKNTKDLTDAELQKILKESRGKLAKQVALREIERRKAMQKDKSSDAFDKGGMPKKKKKVPAIAISVGMVEIPKGKGKAKMAKGGMAYGKQHMYAAGGSVKMNPGLKALQKEAPEVVARMLKK